MITTHGIDSLSETHNRLDAAVAYERFAVPAIFAPAADQLLDAAGPLAGERVLDVGTGTGIVARLAADRVGPTGRVAGLDASPAMLDVARDAANHEGCAISWYEGMAERLPFADASFDLLLCQFALMFFHDRPAALAEMRRVLRPGGRLTLSVFQGIERHPFYAALDRAIERQLGQSTIGTIFALGDANALSEALDQAGFSNVAIASPSVVARPGPAETFLAGEIELDAAAIPAMQSLTRAERGTLVAAIAEEMAQPLAEVTVGGEIVVPFQTHIVRASR
jgi:ubiquinone/menaquinone biosynthesis C-methylase UbiE